jgi:endonuclease YncB( thermonuclease family)
MKNITALPFSLRLCAALITILCLSIPFFAHAYTCPAKRVAEKNMIRLHNGEIVNLFGVDTPGTKHSQKPVEYYSKEASAFIRTIVKKV